jgi:hypothetical protein
VSVSVRERQQVRQYVDACVPTQLRVTATGSWSIYKWGWQFFSSEALD